MLLGSKHDGLLRDRLCCRLFIIYTGEMLAVRFSVATSHEINLKIS